MRYLLTAVCVLSVASFVAADDQKPKRAKPGQQTPDLSRAFNLMDRNRDGHLDKNEFPPRLKDRFSKVDRDGDGKVSRSEWQQASDRLQKAAGNAKRKPGGPGRGKGGAERSGNSVSSSLRFDDMDKNADGRLTRDEVRGSSIERTFDTIDSNKDGKIDPKELDAFKSKSAKSP